GRASCAATTAKTAAPHAVDVPLIGAAWLCEGGEGHLVGHPPQSRGGASLYSARAIDAAPDARRIELDDAYVSTAAASLHVKHAVFRLPPFVRASSLPAPWRAVFLATSGA